MDRQIVDIIVVIIMELAAIRWWFITKGATYRKYILLLNLFLPVSIISYIIGSSLDILVLRTIAGFIFLGAMYLVIKAALSEHRARKYR